MPDYGPLSPAATAQDPHRAAGGHRTALPVVRPLDHAGYRLGGVAAYPVLPPLRRRGTRRTADDLYGRDGEPRQESFPIRHTRTRSLFA
jgi:hypothetical protein